MLEVKICEPEGNVVFWRSDSFDHTKDTLFFSHGLTADHTMFENQIEYFQYTHNIIAWDAPAHGKSRPFSNFTYENAANSIKDILDECSVSKVILIGQSMGGYIAQAFISRYEKYVKAFISIDSTPYGNYYSKSDIWWLNQVEWMAKLFPVKLLKSSIAKQNAITEAGRNNMLHMLNDYTKDELCHLMGIGYAVFLKDNKDLQIHCPVLLIVGEKDYTGKVKEYNKKWAENTGFSIAWIPNAAHNSNVDNPEVVNNHIKEFICLEQI